MNEQELCHAVINQVAESHNRLSVRTVAKRVLTETLGKAPTSDQVRKLVFAVVKFMDDRPIPSSINECDAGGGRHQIRKHILDWE